MKHVYLIVVVLLSSVEVFACSCSESVSFCAAQSKYSLCAVCVVTDHFTNGISLKVIHDFRGNESRDTVRVWDKGGPYDMCNELVSSVASNLGQVGDTIIVTLPIIDSVRNLWDVVGDYMTLGFSCDIYKLPVMNNTVTGLISGAYCQYLHNCIESYNYDQFLIDFPVKSQNCNSWIISGVEEVEKLPFNYYPNPSVSEVVFYSADQGEVTISNQLGQVVDKVHLQGNVTYPTQSLSPGVYYVRFNTKTRAVDRRLVIQH